MGQQKEMGQPLRLLPLRLPPLHLVESMCLEFPSEQKMHLGRWSVEQAWNSAFADFKEGKKWEGKKWVSHFSAIFQSINECENWMSHIHFPFVI